MPALEGMIILYLLLYAMGGEFGIINSPQEPHQFPPGKSDIPVLSDKPVFTPIKNNWNEKLYYYY